MSSDVVEKYLGDRQLQLSQRTTLFQVVDNKINGTFIIANAVKKLGNSPADRIGGIGDH